MNILLALLLGFLPSLVWLMFFLKEDIHPEPRKMIAKAFIFGCISAFAALFIQMFIKGYLDQIMINIPRIIEDNLSVFIGFAFIEEIMKFFFIYVAVKKSTYFDEPIDAMIYMITGALGFAMAENFFLAYSNIQSDVVSLIIIRFIGATLLHALASALIGHYWARGIKLGIEKRMVVAGIVLASIFHIIFNYLVFKFSDFLVYPTAFLLMIGFFVLYDFEELKKMDQFSTGIATTPKLNEDKIIPEWADKYF